MSNWINKDELIEAYRAIGVSKGAVLYVSSDLGKVLPHRAISGEALSAAHLETMQSVIGPSGAVVVPTASMNLINTETVYDPVHTPSSGMGVFSEYVRTRPDARRSMHPFWSCSAVGAEAASLVDNVSRHPYRWGSVFQRIGDHPRALAVHIGILPRRSISLIHRVEAMIGVPYRYTKEFVHPCRTANGIEYGEWYLDVVYRDVDQVRDQNRRLWSGIEAKGFVRECRLGRGRLWAFEVGRFLDEALKLMAADPYIWLAAPPSRRPYRN